MGDYKSTKKDLYLSIVLVVISFLLLLGFTIAWMAKNVEVEGSGMQMDLYITPSLVMGSTTSAIAQESIILSDLQGSQDDSYYYLKPATHYNSAIHGSFAAPTGLVFITTPKRVSEATGNKKTGISSELEYQPVPEYNSGRRYYIDFDTYISSENREMKVSPFAISLVYTSHSGFTKYGGMNNPATLEETQPYIKAASVDFYTIDDSTEKETFIGTLNFAGLMGRNVNGFNNPNPDSLDLFAGHGGTIPNIDDQHLNLTQRYIHLKMRFYFDGALQDFSTSAAIAFVRSNALQVNNFHISVKFDAVEIEQ